MRRIAATALATALLGLGLAQPAAARTLVFWSNTFANKISYAPLIEEGTGADLPIDPAYVKSPYGTAVDAAAGKIYWLNKGDGGSIGYASLDGSGAGFLNTAGAEFSAEPSGLAIDPSAGRIYWGNPNTGHESIGYANLDGSGGGTIHVSGASFAPNALTVDPSRGRIYWSNFGADAIGYANLDGSGAHDLDTSGAPIDGPEGVAIDPYNGRVYWANFEANSLGFAGLDGGGGGEAQLNQFVSKPIGLAIRGQAVYWASEGFDRVEAGNFNGCCTVPLETRGATQSGVAFPVVLESPRLNAIVKVEGDHRPGSLLSCSTPPWEGDQIEAFLYRAPQSVAYQWLRNRQPIPGATGTTVLAGKVGSYTCQVTASNFAGDNVQSNPNAGFAIRASLNLGKVTYNRRKGTALLRLAVTGRGRLAVYGKGVANAQRRRIAGRAKIAIRASGKALIKLRRTGKARVKATIAYTPEGGKPIKRRKTLVLKKRRR